MNKIIFVDDDSDIRTTYEISMQMMFDDKFEIVCLDAEPSLKDMMKVLDGIPDKVTYFIDEKLKHSGIEFVIDKNDWETDQEEHNLKKRFLRHINTYKDIKSEQAQRFDELLEKSLFTTLSEDEIEEFNALNLGRSKKIANESLISDESLVELKVASDELDAMYAELKKDDDE
jgi:hypothetical protein